MSVRLGELLIAEGSVTARDVDEALRTQVISGGRLGTNLVELGYLQLGPLAGALSRQHGLPPALESHFDTRDTRLADAITPELAARWHVVPLYLAGAGGEQIVVASTDPIPAEGLAELAECFGRSVVNGVAPELRILYWLERVYGIDRINRFRRVGRAQTDFDGEPTDPERRGFVRTLSDAEPPEPPSSLARIAVRQIAVPVSGEIDLPPNARSIDDVLKAIRRATGRSRVGNLVMAALENGFDQSLSAAMLAFVRDGVALGWKGFVRGRQSDAIEAVAVPLDEPSLLRVPFETGRPHIGPPGSPSLVDQRLWSLLQTPPPAEIAVLPIALADRIVALLYAQSPDAIPASDVGTLNELATAVGAGFRRLVLAARR